jgi:hypothetical protein
MGWGHGAKPERSGSCDPLIGYLHKGKTILAYRLDVAKGAQDYVQSRALP